MDTGHWSNKLVGEFNVKDYAGFIYKVIDKRNDKFYIGRKFFWQKNGQESYWKRYKTSSKKIKRLMREGVEFEFVILYLCATREDCIDKEIQILLEENVLSNETSYNQAIHSHGYVRDHDSYQDPTFLKNWDEGMRRWRESEDYVHPMQGRVHPNKGKKLPQTAPKKHISLDHSPATDGDGNNRWYPKNQSLPEGWRRGWSYNRPRVLSEEEKVRRKEQGILRLKINEENYYNDPVKCIICGSPVPYQSRLKAKTCLDSECRSRYLSQKLREREVTWDMSRSSAIRMDNLAIEKGFKNYQDLAESIIEYYKYHTSKETMEKFECSWQMIYGSMKYLNFSKQEWRKSNQ